ncbi:MAG: Pnap_2097 family protein [Pseudomonadota bacterium]
MSLGHLRSKERGASQSWSQRLGMAQLAEHSISEHWFLRECGDRHWTLLAEAMGLSTPHFTSEDGRPLYAAFCATELELLPCDVSDLGKDSDGHSTLYGVSKTRTASEHILSVSGRHVARLRMISAFVGHDDSKGNAKIARKTPSANVRLPEVRGDLSEFCKNALASARKVRAETRKSPASLRVTPCPSTDFNAVGLMYFANYSELANRAAWEVLGASSLPRKRSIIYLGNVDRREPIDVRFDELPEGRRKWTFFRSDQTILAQGINDYL